MLASLRRAAGALGLFSFAILSGCAAFPSDKLQAAAVPDVAGTSYRPSAYIDVKFFQGKPGAAGAVEIPAVKPQAQAAVERVLKQSPVFSQYSFDAFEQDKMDCAVKLHFFNHGSSGGSVLMGVISGFTFGVIPAAATDNYTLVTSVTEQGSARPEHQSDDAITTWIGIWFLPAAGKTVEKAVTQTFEELTRDGLRQLVESGELRFEAPVATATSPQP